MGSTEYELITVDYAVQGAIIVTGTPMDCQTALIPSKSSNFTYSIYSIVIDEVLKGSDSPFKTITSKIDGLLQPNSIIHVSEAHVQSKIHLLAHMLDENFEESPIYTQLEHGQDPIIGTRQMIFLDRQDEKISQFQLYAENSCLDLSHLDTVISLIQQ